MGVRAEEKVDAELMKYAKKVMGKTKLLYKLAKAATAQPEWRGQGSDLPRCQRGTLDDLIHEAEADEKHEHQVKWVTRASYSHHYRRIVPALLDVLSFQCNNDRHRPVMDALALLENTGTARSRCFPRARRCRWTASSATTGKTGAGRQARWRGQPHLLRMVCADGVAREGALQGSVGAGRATASAIPTRICLRISMRGARSITRPSDSRVRRRCLWSTCAARWRRRSPPSTPACPPTQVSIVTTKTGKGRIRLTPLEEQPEPPNIVKLTAALVERWPMTNLLDILKETELRVRFTDVFRTVGSREALRSEVLQRRLLLCLYGLGTNAGLKRMCSGGGEDSYADLQYVRRRYVTKEHLRSAIAQVCNAIFRVRIPDLWGEATTACASDSKKFGAWDQNLMTEWHVRYGGPGVMIYWHVEKNSVCIYSQLKACSSSEVAAMIEGVLRHDTEMDVEKQYVDTHGQSEVGFAFCHLLGFALLPRLKNLKKQRLYRPHKGEPEYTPIFRPS